MAAHFGSGQKGQSLSRLKFSPWPEAWLFFYQIEFHTKFFQPTASVTALLHGSAGSSV
jgi:hypothetical protein